MKKVIFVLIFLVLFTFNSYGYCDNSVININLIEAKLNNVSIFETTLDQFTDILGRPTKVNPEQYAFLYFGNDVIYYNKGLFLSFEHSKYDEKQHCIAIKIFLSKIWDANTGMNMEPFSGVLSKNINANWKVKQLLLELAQYNPINKYDKQEELSIDNDPELDQKWKDLKKKSLYIVQIKFEKYIIDFRYEPTTTFLEQVIIYRPDAKSSNILDL